MLKWQYNTRFQNNFPTNESELYFLIQLIRFMHSSRAIIWGFRLYTVLDFFSLDEFKSWLCTLLSETAYITTMAVKNLPIRRGIWLYCYTVQSLSSSMQRKEYLPNWDRTCPFRGYGSAWLSNRCYQIHPPGKYWCYCKQEAHKELWCYCNYSLSRRKDLRRLDVATVLEKQ